MNTLWLLMAKYQSPRLNVDQIADYMGLSPARVRNMIGTHDLPFATYKEGKQHYADLNDVARAHDERIEAARKLREAMLEATA